MIIISLLKVFYLGNNSNNYQSFKSLLFREPPTSVFQLYISFTQIPESTAALYMLLLLLTSNKDVQVLSISNKDVHVLFMFSSNKVAAEEVLQWVPLEQKVVKDVCRLN